MENRGGSEGRMAIARLDKVGLAAIYSPVYFAFKDVALFCIVGLPLHTHTHTSARINSNFMVLI
jgi:hypothetical protein